MAVIGPHAIALSQDERDANTISGELEAVRLRGRKIEDKFHWEPVFSTGQHLLEPQLLELAQELFSRAREGNKLWARGEVVELRDGRGGELERRWTVWDAGYTDFC